MSLKVVFKYELHPGVTTLKLPVGSEPLHVATQHDHLQMWVLVPQDVASWQERHFEVVGTGRVFERSAATYVGTGITGDGEYVLHVFEVASA